MEKNKIVSYALEIIEIRKKLNELGCKIDDLSNEDMSNPIINNRYQMLVAEENDLERRKEELFKKCALPMGQNQVTKFYLRLSDYIDNYGFKFYFLMNGLRFSHKEILDFMQLYLAEIDPYIFHDQDNNYYISNKR